VTDAELQELLRQGAAAARVGEREAAQKAFRRATELAPASKDAWLGLAGAVESLAEKRICFQRVLEIEPDNADAQTGLDWVARKEGKLPAQPAAEIEPALSEDAPVTCVFHPNVETMLRCNKCGRPICVKCAQRTPVGYRCRECIRSQQNVFYTAGWLDYALVIVVGLVVSAIGAIIVGSLSVWFALFLGPVTGGVIAQATRWAARQRQGRYMAHIVSGCIIVGALPALFLVGFNLWGLGGLAVYVIAAVGTAYSRLG